MNSNKSAGAVWRLAGASKENLVLRLPDEAKINQKNLAEKLVVTDVFCKFASGMPTFSSCCQTLRNKVIRITLPFDSRKSRKFTRISQRSVSDVHVYGRGLLLLFC